MMKKLFIFSDIHSYYDEFMESLNRAGFDIDNPDHVIISLGDLCDRGPDSIKALEFVNSIPNNRKILIIGNHELLMEDIISRGYYMEHDKHNRTNLTVQQLTKSYTKDGISKMRNNRLWKNYKKEWRFYFELDKYIFVHGYIPSGRYDSYGQILAYEYDENWRDAGKREWLGATWTNGMAAWQHGIKEEGKTIFCGHWHSSWGHHYLHNDGVEFPDKEGDIARFDPFIDDGIIAIDACTALTGMVNVYVLDIEDEEFERWQ